MGSVELYLAGGIACVRCMLLCVLLLFSLLSSPSVVQLVTSEIDGPPLRNRKRGLRSRETQRKSWAAECM